MATPEPDGDDYSLNDYTSNASFDQGDVDNDADVSSDSERSVGMAEQGQKEYASYSHMVDVAVKSNGQMLSIYHNIVEGQPVFAFSEGYIWVGDTKHGVQVRDVKNFECVKKLGGGIAMRCMAIVDNEVWVGFCNGDIHVYDKNNYDKPPKEITSSSSKTSIDCIAYSAGIIWTGSADWELRARRQSSGATIRSLPDGHRDWIRSILIVGPNLWSSGDDSFIYLWDAETGEKIRTMELKNKHNVKVKCSVLCIVGSTVWGGCADGYIRIWNHAGDYIKRFKAHRGAVTALVCAGAHVWSGGLDKNVKIWERESIKLVETMPVTFPVLTMGMHGTQVYLGGRGVVQVRMTSGLLEWLRDTYRRLDDDYVKVLQVYESLLEKYEAAEPEKMREIINQLQLEKEATVIELNDTLGHDEPVKLQTSQSEIKDSDLGYMRGQLETGRNEENELDDIRGQLETANQEVESLLEERNTIAAKLKAIEESTEKKIKEMEEERQRLKTHVDEHKTRLTESEAKITGHVSKAAEYETKLAEYEAKASEYETKAAEYHTRAAEYESKLAEYNANAADYETQLEQQASEKAELLQQAADLQARIEELEEQLEEATSHGAKSAEHNEKHLANNKELKEKVAKLEKEKQALIEQEQMLKSVVAAKENKITSDRETNRDLEDQVLRLESDVRSRDDTIRVMTAKHEKQVSDVTTALNRATTLAQKDGKPNMAEKCAMGVIFVLCSCLVFTLILFLLVHFSTGSSYHQLRPH